MKATGIVRRMDDLGRVVIPKEIRKTMRISKGDSLEIYTDSSEKIIFKKYSSMAEISSFAENYANVVSKAINLPVIISDCDEVVAVGGASKKEFLGKKISEEIKKLISKRKHFLKSEVKSKKIYPLESLENEAACVVGIISGGDVMGSLIVLDGKEKNDFSKENFLLIKTVAELMGRHLES
ncbi:MAG: AbrB/MazE/SpoVT family DNA-binding domain-containing protein [Clostridia bacterium]|nr:AbrB/MazE/SpoVT family DNA-binding domain-containing protein [Clostridia bacterium]